LYTDMIIPPRHTLAQSAMGKVFNADDCVIVRQIAIIKEGQ
jgi:hypothetical protein